MSVTPEQHKPLAERVSELEMQYQRVQAATDASFDERLAHLERHMAEVLRELDLYGPQEVKATSAEPLPPAIEDPPQSVVAVPATEHDRAMTWLRGFRDSLRSHAGWTLNSPRIADEVNTVLLALNGRTLTLTNRPEGLVEMKQEALEAAREKLQRVRDRLHYTIGACWEPQLLAGALDDVLRLLDPEAQP